jgi:hypothetical protein
LSRLIPRNVLNPMIEARASKIEDPVEKLRFLKSTEKQVGQAEDLLLSPRHLWLRNRKLWIAIACLLLIPSLSLLRRNAIPAIEATAVAGGKLPGPRLLPETPIEPIYLVDTRGEVETWSNGLHIDTRYATTNRPREYYVWNRNAPEASLSRLASQKAAGIVFHTTESTLEELQETKLRRLKLLGESLLSYVKKEQAYHYVIDRFGRVFRVVAESDAANHAGKSTWADEEWAYIGLNDSFLAVSFETQTRAGDEAPEITQAQVDSARMLTRMLRARYGIRAANCVTHAQVSINPSNFQIGYHTDWAGNFPFEAIGLPDNYEKPLASLFLFGFSYDGTFFAATGARMWKGVVASEDLLRARAGKDSISVAQLRTQLRNQYRRLSALLPDNNQPAGNPDSSASDPRQENP